MGRYQPWVVTLAVLSASAPAWAQQSSRVQVASSVSKVLVYSTQARVYRQAFINLRGAAQEVALTDLPAAARQDSLRVESKTAKVVRVEVIRARGRLPRQVKAKELVQKIEATTDKLLLLGDEQRILQSELSLINSLGLRQPRPVAGRRVTEGLFTGAWKQILDWMDRRTTGINARLAKLATERHAVNKTLFALQVEARKLAPTTGQALMPRVVATLAGRPGNVPTATGASGPRVLGTIVPGL